MIVVRLLLPWRMAVQDTDSSTAIGVSIDSSDSGVKPCDVSDGRWRACKAGGRNLQRCPEAPRNTVSVHNPSGNPWLVAVRGA